MRRWLFLFFVLACLVPDFGRAADMPSRDTVSRLLAIHINPSANSTGLQIELSRPVAFRISTHNDPDSIAIDMPGVEWPSNVPASGMGVGFVSVYRRAISPQGGVRLIVETSTSVKVSEAGMGLAIPGHPTVFNLDIRSDDGSPPPATVEAAPRTVAAIPAVQPPPEKPAAAALHYLAPSPAPAAVAMPVALTAKAPLAVPTETRRTTRRVIAIDPGHGGFDPGTSSAEGVFEKSITLATGLVLKNVLEATGRYSVVMTRSDDTFIPLQDRVKNARAAGAELFISLHCDAMEGHDAQGATVYTLSQTASDAVSERLAAAENRSAAIGGLNLAREDAGTADLLIDLSMRDSMNQSNRFAELLVGQFAQRHIRLQELKPHRSAGFAVLKAADMPSVLIEMGYLSDPEDAALLANPVHQREISVAITAGVDRYFRVGETGGRS